MTFQVFFRRTVLLAAVAVAAVAAGFLSRYLAGAAGAVGLPLAAAFSFSGMSLMTLAMIGVGGLVAGILLSMLVSAIMSGGGGGGFRLPPLLMQSTAFEDGGIVPRTDGVAVERRLAG